MEEEELSRGQQKQKRAHTSNGRLGALGLDSSGRGPDLDSEGSSPLHRDAAIQSSRPTPAARALQDTHPARARGAQDPPAARKGAHPQPTAAAGSATCTSGGEALLTICVEFSGNCSSACALSKSRDRGDHRDV